MLPQLIETMRVDADGRIPLLERHIDRLIGSSISLGYDCPEAKVLDTIQNHTAKLDRGHEHRLRLLLDRKGGIEITTAPLPPLSNKPCIGLASRRLSSDTILLRYKTTHRPWFNDATTWLSEHPDYFDLLFLNEQGQLCEGSRSNVYLLLDSHWHTPAPEAGLLPGVQRAEILAQGLATERILTQDDLHRAQAIRLSNALRGWFDVTLQT